MCTGHGPTLMRDGATAAAGLLRKAYGVDVSKASALDPLVDKDFVTLASRLARSLSHSVGYVNEEALAEATADLEVDWAELSPAEREEKYKKLKAAILALALLSIPATAQVLAKTITQIIKDTKSSTIAEGDFEISAVPSEADKNSGAFLLSSQEAFTELEYERRADTIEEMVREMVDKGLENGLEGAAIAALVIRAVQAYSEARDVAYWDVTANVLANRARTVTQLNTFAEAGAARVRFVCVMDGAQCATCEFMSGRETSVGSLQGVQRSTEALVDPEDIVAAQPWLSHDEKGIYYNRRGQRTDVASDVSTEDLVAEGLFLTPIHGRCRCKLEAVSAPAT